MNVNWAGISCIVIFAMTVQPALSEDWPGCKFQCRANDVTVSRLWIGDHSGDDLLSGVPGEKQSCYLWATFHNNANTPRYAAILLADLYLNGTLSKSFYDSGQCVLEKIEPKSTLDYPICSLIWTRGEEIMLKRFVLSWETAKGTGCSQANRKCSNRNTKCYGGPEFEFQVDTPLSVVFAEDLQECSNEVKFFDRTSGGIGPYAYDWDFDDGFHSQEKNPTHTYESPGNYSVRLLAKDQSGKEASSSQKLVVNLCPCTIVGQEYACLGKTENYRVSMSGSFSGSIEWHLDGREIIGGELLKEEGIDIDWQDFGLGRHDLVAYVTDTNSDNGQKQSAACNMTITVLPLPVATINMVV